MSVTDSTFAYCASSALSTTSETSKFSTYARNTIVDSEVGLWMHANTIG